MRLDKIFVVAKREFLSRLKTKSFWLSTLLLPIFLVIIYSIPALVLLKGKSDLEIVLVDQTGRLAPAVSARIGELNESPVSSAHFSATIETEVSDPAGYRDALDQRLLEEDIDAWVWIDEAGLEENEVEYHGKVVSGFLIQELLGDAISDAVRDDRLVGAGYDPKAVSDLTRRIHMKTIKVTSEGSREELGSVAFFLGYGIVLILYMVIMIWGTQVMTGVLEEKSSRIVEVMVSTVKPAELMLGKVFGIGGVGLLQLGVWLGTAAALTAPALLSSISWMPEGFSLPSISLGMVFHMLAFFVLGFFAFASIYAALGASFNNIQEAQQFASLPMVLLLTPLLLAMPISNTPDAPWAVALSMIPMFSPSLIPLRLVVSSVPTWQLAMAYLLTALFTLFAAWLAARIYRIGILMYGKKPSAKELFRWIRHG